MERTFVIIKPDAINKAIVGKITSRLEDKGFKLVACKMKQLDEAILKTHYAHIADKPFFPDIVSFMTMSPVVLQVWEGVEVVEVVRTMLGITNARKAAPGTIRGDYANSIGRNVMHASEDITASKEEIARFFDEKEVFSYANSNEGVIYDAGEK